MSSIPPSRVLSRWYGPRSVVMMALVVLLPTGSGRGTDPRSAAPSSTIELVGIAVPYQTITLASVVPARIQHLLADEGTTFPAGTLIVQLDDAVQAARTEIARAAAESTLDIELARAHLDKAQRDLDHLVRLHGSDSASSKELSDTRAEVEVRRIEHLLARFQHEQAQRAFERDRRQLEEYRLTAPFDGYVVEHLKRPGETVDQLEGIVTLAQLDPLRVLVDCPIWMAPNVNTGDRLSVRCVEGRGATRTGTVIMASRVADGGSQTFRVKLVVDNADGGWLAGLKVAVTFPAHKPDAAVPAARTVSDRRGEPSP